MTIPTAYLWLRDEQGNDVDGPVTAVGFEGAIAVLGFSLSVQIPIDDKTGQPTGVGKHRGVKIVKAVDASSSYLFDVCQQGQMLQEVTLRLYKMNALNQQVEYCRYIFEGVRIILFTPEASSEQPSREALVFRYKKITNMFIDGDTTHAESWSEE